MPLNTHISSNEYLVHFLPIAVSFLTYLVIFTPDKMLLIFQLSLTSLFHVLQLKLKLKQDSMFLFISWVTDHLGEISRCLAWHLPQVFAFYLPLIIISLHLYINHMMTKYSFFMNKVERWKRDLASLWGNFNICPHLDHFEFPCHSPAELNSVSSFKVWVNTQEPCHDITYLLVCTGNTTEDRQYSVSLVWVNCNQTRASTMEEAVEMLAPCPSSGTDWPYALAQLYKSSCHAPLPKDKHLGILPQGKVEETSCGQISQLNVCQLLSTGSQVVYPIGLNGHDEPIITTLPELLSSSISIIASEHPYLEIDIPPKEESDTKALPIGKASIIKTTNPCKSSPKLEGSMSAEVNDLLDQAIMEASSCESEHSSLGKITTAAVTTSPPQKLEVSVPPIDTSSQASIEEEEGSLEDIPANISLIAAVYRSRNVSPLVDPSELQANANRAINNMLHLKRSPRHKEAESHLGTGGVVLSE